MSPFWKSFTWVVKLSFKRTRPCFVALCNKNLSHLIVPVKSKWQINNIYIHSDYSFLHSLGAIADLNTLVALDMEQLWFVICMYRTYNLYSLSEYFRNEQIPEIFVDSGLREVFSLFSTILTSCHSLQPSPRLICFPLVSKEIMVFVTCFE